MFLQESKWILDTKVLCELWNDVPTLAIKRSYRFFGPPRPPPVLRQKSHAGFGVRWKMGVKPCPQLSAHEQGLISLVVRVFVCEMRLP